MDRKGLRPLLLILLLALCLLLTGCRTRITGSGQGDIAAPAAGGAAAGDLQGDQSADMAASAEPGDTEENTDPDGGEPGDRARENPEAPRKEYDPDAPAEIVPGTDRLLHGPGEGSGMSAAGEEEDTAASRLNDGAQETATQVVAAQEAERMGEDPDAEAADSALTYYTVLLQDRMGSLFECQRANVYWETAQDHVTVHKTSPEHALILQSGAYDVSSRLLPENLLVDDGWVVRKNPQVIVKVVDGAELARSAEAVYRGLLAREGWGGTDAVRSGQVLLLSGELLEAPWLQTAAMLLIAKTANPSLFEDVDADTVLQMLAQEATGSLPAGVYYYTGKEI